MTNEELTMAILKSTEAIKKNIQPNELLDCITNLQEENEMYKKELEKADSITQSCIFEGSRSAGKSYRQCLNLLEDYKSRIDKAIKFINKYCIDDEFYINLSYKEKAILEVLKILEGDDKDE